MIKFPYGRRDFYELITENYLYVDRTQHIRFVEDWGKEHIRYIFARKNYS